MKIDVQIQKDVMDELKWQPSLNSSEIGVAVKNGIVTLSGSLQNATPNLPPFSTTTRLGSLSLPKTMLT